MKLPRPGKVFISVQRQRQGRGGGRSARESGRARVSALVATRGTAAAIAADGIAVAMVNKVAEGRPHIVDMIKNGEISLIVNTVEEKRSGDAAIPARSARAALHSRVTYYTTLAGARAACTGMRHIARARFPTRCRRLHRRSWFD